MQRDRLQTKEWNDMKQPPGRETAFNIVLTVSPNDEDRTSLERIVESGWTVIASATVSSALALLREFTNSNRNLRLRVHGGHMGGDVGPHLASPRSSSLDPDFPAGG